MRAPPGGPRIDPAEDPVEALLGLPDSYQRWRSSRLGRITDALERELLLELAGALQERAALDVGCGDGDLALTLARRGADVTALDCDPRMLARTRDRLVSERAAARLVRGSGEALPLASESFDLVTAITVLCFVGEAPAALGEMSRVLKPGGYLVVGDLGRWNAWAAARRVRGWLGSPTWRAARFRGAGELRRLVESAGLCVTSVRGAIFYPPLGWCASIGARVDRRLGMHSTLGAAFISVAARKPPQTD